jgi:hypothetical protein
MKPQHSSQWSHLVAQAHGLYLRLRDRAGDGEQIPLELVHQAYERYQRRVGRGHQSGY